MVRIYTSDKNNGEEIKNTFEMMFKRNCEILDKKQITKRDFNILKYSDDYTLGSDINDFITDESETITVVAENGAMYNFIKDDSYLETDKIALDTVPYKKVLNESVKIPFLSKETYIGIFNFIMYFVFQRYIVLFVILLLMFLVDLLFSISPLDAYYEIAIIGQALPLLIYCGLWIFFKYKDDYLDQLRSLNLKNFFTKVIKYLAIGYGLAVVFSSLSYLVLYLSGQDIVSSENQESVDLLAQNVPIILFIFMTSFYAPIVEEFFFRFILIDKVLGFSKKIYIKVIISTILFILIHTDSEMFAFFSDPTLTSFATLIAVMLQYAGITIAMSYAYAKERNIYICMLVHASFNFLATLATFAG